MSPGDEFPGILYAAITARKKSLSYLGRVLATLGEGVARVEIRGAQTICLFQTDCTGLTLVAVRKATKPFRGRELWRMDGYLVRQDVDKVLVAFRSTVVHADSLLSDANKEDAILGLEGPWRTLIIRQVE